MKIEYVSVLIPMRNEKYFIARCLDSIAAQEYPKDRFEVLVVDGMSTDGSRQILQGYAQRYPFVRLLDNPRGVVPAALNIGIPEAKGEIIIRMDAHATYTSDYVRQCAELLQTTGAANVGGGATGGGDKLCVKDYCISYYHPLRDRQCLLSLWEEGTMGRNRVSRGLVEIHPGGVGWF